MVIYIGIFQTYFLNCMPLVVLEGKQENKTHFIAFMNI